MNIIKKLVCFAFLNVLAQESSASSICTIMLTQTPDYASGEYGMSFFYDAIYFEKEKFIIKFSDNRSIEVTYPFGFHLEPGSVQILDEVYWNSNVKDKSKSSTSSISDVSFRLAAHFFGTDIVSGRSVILTNNNSVYLMTGIITKQSKVWQLVKLMTIDSKILRIEKDPIDGQIYILTDSGRIIVPFPI